MNTFEKCLNKLDSLWFKELRCKQYDYNKSRILNPVKDNDDWRLDKI